MKKSLVITALLLLGHDLYAQNLAYIKTHCDTFCVMLTFDNIVSSVPIRDPDSGSKEGEKFTYLNPGFGMDYSYVLPSMTDRHFVSGLKILCTLHSLEISARAGFCNKFITFGLDVGKYVLQTNDASDYRGWSRNLQVENTYGIFLESVSQDFIFIGSIKEGQINRFISCKAAGFPPFEKFLGIGFDADNITGYGPLICWKINNHMMLYFSWKFVEKQNRSQYDAARNNYKFSLTFNVN